jgi:NitT/TauT family transport system ATP-binding protein
MPPDEAAAGARVRAGRIDLARVTLGVGQPGRRLEVVRNVSVSFAPGELACLLGPSGCGKSTLLGAIAGFVGIDRGTIAVDGVPVDGPSAGRGMVFQQHTLLPWRTALDNVAFGLELRGVPLGERRARAAELLDLVGLAGFERHHPDQLSGGMQQRVELARALINRPPVLLMDEPFGALDAQTRMDMQDLLLEVWDTMRPTIVFVTHDVDEAVFLADRVLVMTRRPGEICAEIPVPLPRSRTAEVLASRDFVDLRRRGLELVRKEARRGRTDQTRGNKERAQT